MHDEKKLGPSPPQFLYAVDIGSTVIKFAQLDSAGKLLKQDFYDRNFDTSIIEQLDSILAGHEESICRNKLFICSSANGGLRVGIICLTNSYSGAIYRNQVLLGGANPMYVHEITSCTADTRYVDILLVGGGIDCPDIGLMTQFHTRLSLSGYQYGSLVFAGNSHLTKAFQERFPEAQSIDNPMANGLTSVRDTVFTAIRNAYLDDLVYKQGVSEVAAKYSGNIRPTPEVVNRGYYAAITDGTFYDVSGASILMDIGGATTDIHYAVELINDDSENRPPLGSSVARYVFADLGIFVSKDSTTLQLRRNPRTFEFLDTVLDTGVNETYRLLREGEFDLPREMLSYACIFLGVDRFSRGDGPGLPTAELAKLNKLVLTGGAAQLLDEEKVARIVSLFLPGEVDERFVLIDRKYEIWIQGAISDYRANCRIQ